MGEIVQERVRKRWSRVQTRQAIMTLSSKNLVLYPLLLQLVPMFRAAPNTLGPEQEADSVPRPPRWTDKNSLQQVVAKPFLSKVLLSCKSTGYPAPEIFWTKDGVRIEKNSAKRQEHFKYYRVKSMQQQLVIKQLMKAHEGIYTCNISNKWGNLQHSIVVEVEGLDAPKVIERPENRTVAVGMDTHLKCVVDSGDLVPSIHWAKVTELGSETRPKFSMIPEYRNKEELVLRNVTKKDQGLYACVIRADAGNTIERAYVHVLEDYEAIQQAPMNTTPHSVRMGIEAKLIATVICVSSLAIFLVIVIFFIYRAMQKEQKGRIFVERNHLTSQRTAQTPQTPTAPQEPAEYPDTPPPSYDESMFGLTKGEEAFNRRLELFAQETSIANTL